MKKQLFLISILLSFMSLFVLASDENRFYSEEWDVGFDIPENFIEVDFKDDSYTVAQFKSEITGNGFSFGVVDLWEKLPKKEKEGHSRSELSQSNITEKDMREFLSHDSSSLSSLSEMSPFGFNKSDCYEVEYNGVDYYKLNGNYSTMVHLERVDVDVTVLIRYDMGRQYMFIYATDFERSHDFDEFERMIESVEYPEIEDEHVDKPLSETLTIVFFVVFFILMIVGAIILFVKIRF